MTAKALESQNVDELLRLTDPEELQRLNLNHENVSAFLKETVFRSGPVGRLAVSQDGDYPVDELSYSLVPLDRHDLFQHIQIKVTELPDGRWSLPLGYLLLASYGSTHRDMDALARHNGFIQEASGFGIKGVRTNELGYQIFGHPPEHIWH